VRSLLDLEASPLIIFTEPVPPARTVIKDSYGIYTEQSKICGSGKYLAVKYGWTNCTSIVDKDYKQGI
jgi:hypothetical protein